MAEKHYSKVQRKTAAGYETIIDLTSDTVTAADIAKGKPAHGKDGAPITGTSTKDSDTSDASAEASDILSGITAYAKGAKLTGTIKNNGPVSATITSASEKVSVPAGYTSGGTISLDDTASSITPENIRKGVTILGVTGTSDTGADTSDATAGADDVLSGKTAYISSGKVTGTMPNNGSTGGVISTQTGVVKIPAGYTTGGSVQIDSTAIKGLTPENIASGVTILGVEGTKAVSISYSENSAGGQTATIS